MATLIPTVNLRELHAFVGSSRDFSSWAKKRLTESMAEEGVDYLLTKFGEQVPHQGGFRAATRIDYHVTLDTAKHIGMLRSQIGG